MHYFRDFKGFKDVSIDLTRPFTLLIGPNGSGKTNVIEAIELLSFIARGQPLYEIADVGRTETGLQIRGGLQACGRMDRPTFLLGFNARTRFDGEIKPVAYRIRIRTKPHPQIQEEELKVGNRVIYKTLVKNPWPEDLIVIYDNFAVRGRKPQAAASSERSVLSQYPEIVQKNRKLKQCIRLVQKIMYHLQASFVFDPNPKLMRDYERIGNNILSKDGANLSAVLYSLTDGDETQRASLDRLLSQISQLPDEPYDKIDFTTTNLGDVIFWLREKTGYKIDARSLSDGTLRTLAILTALETVQAGSHVIVEQFDNGLHPGRVGVLTSAIAETIERRDLRVLVTTHNLATMNNLTPEQIKGVVLCTWSEEKQAADLIALESLPRSDELLERGPLGDLVSRRVIEQYLAPEFEKQHRQKMLEWVKTLP
ncbi:MAG: ATP-binding protein [Candidatus Latescibacteria bacterium]|nr:ATP-binding protein [Candidatus Latescibacterota bacterium]